MEKHISKDQLARLFSYAATPADILDAVTHILGCPQCQDVAADGVASLKRSGDLVPSGRGRPPEDRFGDGRAALVALLELREGKRMESLLAKAWVAELKDLRPREQIDKVRKISAIQKKEVFDAILRDAARLWRKDPFAAEHSALSALFLVDQLSGLEFSDREKDGLRLSAMTMVANTRRLASNWAGAFSAISDARGYLKTGNVNLSQHAYLVSIHASLLCDVGQLEESVLLVSKAADLYEAANDRAGLATMKVKAADALFGADRIDESLKLAEQALALLPSGSRLELLARSIITESLIHLGNISEAVSTYEKIEPLFYAGDELSHFKAEYLEAKILDAGGHARESEKLFRKSIAGFTELEAFKPGLLARFALFESLFKRFAFGKCVSLCEETIDLLENMERSHIQMPQVWKDLLAAVRVKLLKEYHIVEMRRYLARHWAYPAARIPAFCES
jgi:tetratricopeptide (TPR) repeat protein